jgi:GNAT superfamily N-acetyltransferase
MDLIIHPAASDRWDDVVTLFGDNGAYSNCWCTWWLYTNKEFEEAGKRKRRNLLQRMVETEEVPGLLAYADTLPIGWVAVGPRERYGRMMSPHSRVFRPLDDEPSWVINCFYIADEWRGMGVATMLLEAAVRWARTNGATRIDAYPKEVPEDRPPDSEMFTGSLQMFLDAGFRELTRMNDRPVVRLGR